MTYITGSSALRVQSINGYSVDAQAAKVAFHEAADVLLKKLAASLGIEDYGIRSNMAGMAVSGEVTLHSADIYVQVFESCTTPGAQLMYRSCASKSDYCGHRNHFVSMGEFLERGVQGNTVACMAKLIAVEKARKLETPVSIQMSVSA